MRESKQGPSSGWLTLVIVVRVTLFLSIWLVVFMSMFLGYSTVPLLLIALLVLVYTITDAGLVVALVRQRARQARRAFLDAHYPDAPPPVDKPR